MTQFGLSGVGAVDLSRFWPAWNAIDQERELVTYYAAARDFWGAYDTKLTLSRDNVTDLRRDMELYTNWTNLGRPEAASTAFYRRVNDGIGSVQAWLNGGTSTVRDRFNELATRLPEDVRMVDLHRETLLTQDKVVDMTASRGPIAAFTTVKIVEGDGEVNVPVLRADAIRQAVEDTVRRHDELMVLFRQIVDDLDKLPDNVTWAGPTTVAPEAAPGGGPGAGPGGGPGGPAAPGGPGAAPGAMPGAGPDPAQESMPAPGADVPGAGAGPADQTGADVPGGDLPGGPAVDPVTGDPNVTLPTSDPALAGTPSATLSPTALSPATPSPSTLSPLSSNVSSGAGPTTSPFPLTPTGVSPSPGGPLARRDGVGSPGPGASTVDSQRGASVTGESPVRARGGPAGSTGSTIGPGFYPPMVPPMGGMAGRNGIRPGEADFAGGSVRQAGGRDSWRAGLRPQLLGRAGEPDDEPYQLPPVRTVSGDEVLDEELWQVPDAAPATPPEPPRRGRSWGPG
jgi:hypothetical protein